MTPARCTVRFALTFALVALARQAEAQDARPRGLSVEVGVFGGVFMPDEHHEFYDPTVSDQQELQPINPDFGVHLSFYPWSWVGIEGEGSGSFSETDGGNTANLYSLRGSLVLQIPWRVAPFILGGVGSTWLRSEDSALGEDRDRVWHGGAGLKIFATSALEFRLEGRIYYSNQERSEMDATDDNGMVAHYGALAGVTWLIGGRSTTDKFGDPDPDADGVVAIVDKCPDQQGVEPDGCPSQDGDGDGLHDAADRCPTEPETVNGHDDSDGCPDDVVDADGDGVTDASDKCPGRPEDRDGFQDRDGCPDVDDDRDGVADGSDACPAASGPPENRGCPDSDQDGDGVVDRVDNCPELAGRPGDHGCRSVQLVAITPSQLLLFKQVQFGSTRARIARPSRRLLDNVASVIRQHPEFRTIRVEGHTDDQGADEVNKVLSQQRAQAVVSYLIARGVEGERLKAIGYGEELPMASNRTESGRKKNRRVEFNLEDVRPAGSTQAGKPPDARPPREAAPPPDARPPDEKDEVLIKPPRPESGGGGQ